MATDAPPPSLPPRGERFADPSARVVWAAITALPVASQHQILASLRERLGSTFAPGSQADRVAHAVRALREAAEILGRSPSVEEGSAQRGSGLQGQSNRLTKTLRSYVAQLLARASDDLGYTTSACQG